MSKDIRLTFGKHKGKLLSEIPIGYLGWLLTKYEGNSIKKEDIEKEAISRGCEKRGSSWGIDLNKHPEYRPIARVAEKRKLRTAQLAENMSKLEAMFKNIEADYEIGAEDEDWWI